MTIKGKLITNVLLTTAIIIAISLASFFSMRFLQEKLSYLTERSTPFQIRTIELQRELQQCITTLIKVNAARTMTEYTTFRTEYEKSLAGVRKSQKSMEKLSNSAQGVSDELDKIALELFAAVEDRIHSNDAATAANAKVSQSIRESSYRFKDLDTSIRNLQINYSSAFTATFENTRKFSDKLRSIEELRNLVRELQLIAVAVHNARTGSSILIVRGKLKAVTARIHKNEYFKSNKSISVIATGFTNMLDEYVRLQSAVLAQEDEDSKNKAADFGTDLSFKLNDLFQTLDQETMLVRDELTLANSRQGNIFAQANSANSLLVANSELVALGLMVTGETNRLFTVESVAELGKLDSEIRSLFTKIYERVQRLESSLNKLNAGNEVNILRAAVASLATVRNEIYATDGIVTRLKKKLNAIEQANTSAEKLRDIVIRQTAKGNESVLAAQGEQEKSIAAVNSMVRRSLYQILGISFAAVVIGVLFGFWIYRSVLLPLRVVLAAVNSQQEQGKEKANLAEAVAGGDLSRKVIVSEAITLDPAQVKKDEMGMVLNAIVGMSKAQVTLDMAFSAMVGKVREARESLEKRVEERTEQLFRTNEELNDEIHERERVEQDLRKSEQFIRNVLDTVDEGFIVVDRDYRIMTANTAYCRLIGGCGEDIIGRHCYEVSHWIDHPCYEEGQECAVRNVFASGAPHSSIHHHKDSKGNILYVETKAYPIKDASGNVTSAIETITNITERHLLEEERLKTQKLESIGTLAGGIAHDFNNLLQGIFGYISMAKMSLDHPERTITMLQQAEEALHLSVNLTKQLLTFSKGGKPVKKLIQLEMVIENAVKFALSGSHTDYLLDISSDLWLVEADEGQMAQVIQNIVINANEAMAGRGTVVVSVKNADIPRETVPGLPDGGRFVSLSIQDFGAGISGENLAKIFDPYFTTKYKGSGLGLATSYSIIRNHGGVIEVQSEVDKGSTFTIYLPAAKEAAMAYKTTTAMTDAVRKGKILVMDDEEFVRNVAKAMIEALGHEVECAASGEAAIEMFSNARESGSPYDVVILDLTVKGGMGGEAAVKRLGEIDPDVVAVVSSGFADNTVVADFQAYGFSAFLNKPYNIDALRDCLNKSIKKP